ncbi:hypothetical protein RNI52_00085 [Labrys neptuniae]|uniref:hypothetical protein n=1 Tax=Labrys neptuniae TaxID=376174 RepID=UPI00288D19A6|nr:hypothetical protein [Labrys neptuniae]MDT3375708.1 hypothetical protein [Labrys neptuniae]
MGRLRLDKHYGDAILDDGTVVIFYSATLRLGLLALHYASLATIRPCGTRELRQWLRAAPMTHGRAITARCGDIALAWHSCGAATPDVVLHDEPAGALHWQARMPLAEVRITRAGESEATGLGYFETLAIDLWPTRWPIRTLHWGRFTGRHTSLVWIVWEHEQPRQWLFLDGVPACLDHFDLPRSFAFTGVSSGTLICGPARTLIAQPVSQRLRLLGPLRYGLPAMIRNLKEEKHMAPARIAFSDGSEDEGYVIFEKVALA